MQTPQTPPLLHSGWGIASLVISLLSWPVVLILAYMLAKTRPNPMPRAAPGDIPSGIFSWFIEDVLFKGFKEGLAELVNVALLFPGFTLLLALGLGIAGWLQRDRESAYAILGSLVSAVGVASVLALILM